MKTLDIIVPVYNVESYLQKCVDSILLQTYRDFECILIDDGSFDKSSEICDSYVKNDNRLIIIHQTNKGVSSARNKGLDIVDSEYIGFVDSDDWIESEMYETMIDINKNNEYDVVICGINYYSDRFQLEYSNLLSESEYNKDELFKALYGKPNPIGGGLVNKVFKKEVVDNIRCKEELKMAEDWVFLFEYFIKSNRAIKIKNAFYNVIERKNSATRKNEAKAYYDIVFGGKLLLLLLLLARSYSFELEKIATDKYIDDCIRYSNIIREIGTKNSSPWKWYFIKIRLKALSIFPRVIVKKILPKNKINGYLYELIKL